LLLRLRRSLRRLDLRPYAGQQEPADRAWSSMLARIALEERERRLQALEQALNGTRH
jgi:TorA maturation chaperone TorD